MPGKRVAVRVPAKINLQLSVGPARPDGFHGLATVYCAISLYDQVTVEPATDLSLTVTGAYAQWVPTDSTNLALRAVRLLAAECGISDPGLAVTLHKGIPVAGGMAGGSADAAGALLAAAQCWEVDVPPDRLLALATQLGSDVPFPLLGGVAVGVGRGEQVTPVLADSTYYWVVAMADGGLSTPAVFKEWDRQHPDASVEPEVSEDLLRAVREGDAAALGAAMSNDLQVSALALRPELADTLAAGEAAGALAAMLSGSGPTALFLARDEAHAAEVAEAVRAAPAVRNVEVARGPVPGAAVIEEDA